MKQAGITKTILAMAALMAALAGATTARWVKADSFDVIRDGKTYRCELVADGSQCWDRCRRDGYSFSTCRSLCNTKNDACWSHCKLDGNSFRTCRDYCSTATPSCWTACEREGYSFSTCRNYCTSATADTQIPDALMRSRGFRTSS